MIILRLENIPQFMGMILQFWGKYFPMFSTRTEYRACVMYKLLEVLYFERTAISAAREISCGWL